MTAIALLTASCSDDENNENESINPAVNIAGTYAGYSEAAFQYTDTPLVSADESLTIQTDADNTTATITYTSSSFGEFTISGTHPERRRKHDNGNERKRKRIRMHAERHAKRSKERRHIHIQCSSRNGRHEHHLYFRRNTRIQAIGRFV